MSRSSRETIALPPPPADYGVVLLSHSSPDPRARLACDLLARRVGHRLGAHVAQATIDLNRPRLDGAIQYLGTKGIHDLVVVPMLLTTSPNAEESKPTVMKGSPHGFSGVRVIMASPLGADPHLLRGLDAVLKSAGHRPNSQTAVVLASAGSSYAGARDRHRELAMQWQTHGWGASTVAFASGAGPTVEDAVHRLHNDGFTEVCVSPFLIAPGAMSQRIAEQAKQAGAQAVTGTLHSTDAAMEVLLRRVRAAVDARGRMLASAAMH